MRRARERGFFVRLVYVCVENSDWNIERVRERVATGGHDVPEDDVRRRYERSLSNLPVALQLAHEAVVYDNSGSGPRRVLHVQDGIVVWRGPDEPQWVADALTAFLPNTASSA